MDIVSHGLWGGAAFGRKSKRSFWLAFLFGISPDLFSFGIFTIMTLLGFVSGPDWSNGPPDARLIPTYVYSLYNATHSLVIFAVVFGMVWLLLKRPVYEMLAWPLHILMDIPTHSTKFFATPFLWPLTDYKVNGIPWSHPWIFFPDWILLVLIYSYFYFQKRKRKNVKTDKRVKG